MLRICMDLEMNELYKYVLFEKYEIKELLFLIRNRLPLASGGEVDILNSLVDKIKSIKEVNDAVQ